MHLGFYVFFSLLGVSTISFKRVFGLLAQKFVKKFAKFWNFGGQKLVIFGPKMANFGPKWVK